MRFLIITTPFTGHITPTFKMAENLMQNGHIIDYLTTSTWQSKITHIGATLIEYEENKKLSLMIRNAYKIALSIGNQYDGILYDELFFPGNVLGKSINKPVVRFFPCIAINQPIMIQLISGKGFMGIFRLSFVRKRWTKKICTHLIPDIIDWTEEVTHNTPDCNIVFVPDWFQPYVDDFPKTHFHFVGPSISYDSNETIHTYIKNSNAPLIYMSLGTIENKQLRFYKKCLKLFADKNAQFIFSVGYGIATEKLGEIPKNCTVYAYVPQKEILASADLFITHGGMNSINEAMVAGVPMLVLPISNDQPINATQVKALGIGKVADMKNLTADRLWKNISSMLSDKALQARVEEIKEKLKDVEGGKKGAQRIITFFT